MLEAIKKFFKYILSALENLTKDSMVEVPLPAKEPDSKNYFVKLWCPFASYAYSHPVKGKYINNYPLGAVIHATAGQDRNEQDAIDTIQWGKEQGYSFFMIGPTGKIYQTMSLDYWGSHCGKSSWPGLTDGLSNQLVGIEVACAGKLERFSENIFKSWFGEKYQDLDKSDYDQVRIVPASFGCPAGAYKKFTKEQEDALLKLLYWLKTNNPNVFSYDYVLGHHEISPGRKSDPGGSLSMPMSAFRKKLKETLA